MGAQWKAKGKALVADAKGKLFGKLVKEITVAARLGGGDPASNSRLRMAVEAARKASMPKDTLERAIKKGSGAGADAVNYSTVLFEGYAPHRVPVMVECLTDNPNRTAPNMRVCFRKGQLTAVAWDFDHVGMVEGEPENGADVELAAIEAGAQDFEPAEEEGVTLFITEPTDLDTVSKALPEQASRCCRPSWVTRPRPPSAWAACLPKRRKKCKPSWPVWKTTTTCKTSMSVWWTEHRPATPTETADQAVFSWAHARPS